MCISLAAAQAEKLLPVTPRAATEGSDALACAEMVIGYVKPAAPTQLEMKTVLTNVWTELADNLLGAGGRLDELMQFYGVPVSLAPVDGSQASALIRAHIDANLPVVLVGPDRQVVVNGYDATRLHVLDPQQPGGVWDSLQDGILLGSEIPIVHGVFLVPQVAVRLGSANAVLYHTASDTFDQGMGSHEQQLKAVVPYIRDNESEQVFFDGYKDSASGQLLSLASFGNDVPLLKQVFQEAWDWDQATAAAYRLPVVPLNALNRIDYAAEALKAVELLSLKYRALGEGVGNRESVWKLTDSTRNQAKNFYDQLWIYHVLPLLPTEEQTIFNRVMEGMVAKSQGESMLNDKHLEAADFLTTVLEAFGKSDPALLMTHLLSIRTEVFVVQAEIVMRLYGKSEVEITASVAYYREVHRSLQIVQKEMPNAAEKWATRFGNVMKLARFLVAVSEGMQPLSVIDGIQGDLAAMRDALEASQLDLGWTDKLYLLTAINHLASRLEAERAGCRSFLDDYLQSWDFYDAVSQAAGMDLLKKAVIGAVTTAAEKSFPIIGQITLGLDGGFALANLLTSGDQVHEGLQDAYWATKIENMFHRVTYEEVRQRVIAASLSGALTDKMLLDFRDCARLTYVAETFYYRRTAEAFYLSWGAADVLRQWLGGEDHKAWAQDIYFPMADRVRLDGEKWLHPWIAQRAFLDGQSRLWEQSPVPHRFAIDSPSPEPGPLNLSAAVSASTTAVEAGQRVEFVATVSGGTLPYGAKTWDFGDGIQAKGEAAVTHAYTSAGTYIATFEVTDATGTKASDSLHLSVVGGQPSDTRPPTSTVAPLPHASPPQFLLCWIGADETGGSGLKCYDIQYRVMDENYNLKQDWRILAGLDDTTLTSYEFDAAKFPEIRDHYYLAFRSSARDYAGHQEPYPGLHGDLPDTVTRIDASVNKQHSFTLEAAGYNHRAVPGKTTTFVLTLRNTGEGADTYRLAWVRSKTTWPVALRDAAGQNASTISVGSGAAATLYLSVTAPADAAEEQQCLVGVTATSQSNGDSQTIDTATRVDRLIGLDAAITQPLADREYQRMRYTLVQVVARDNVSDPTGIEVSALMTYADGSQEALPLIDQKNAEGEHAASWLPAVEGTCKVTITARKLKAPGVYVTATREISVKVVPAAPLEEGLALQWKMDVARGHGEAAIAAGNLDGACARELVVADGPLIYALNAGGAPLWQYTHPAQEYFEEVNLADIDGDGFDEVIASGSYTGVVALDHDGTLLWSRQPTANPRGLYGQTVVANVDFDDELEVVYGSGDQNVYVFGALTGAEKYRYSTAHEVRAVGVGKLDDSGVASVVFAQWDPWRIVARNFQTGAELTHPIEAEAHVAKLCVGDVTGDGVPEIVVGVGLHPAVLLLDKRLNTLWSRSVTNEVGDLTVWDLNGDGTNEIVAATGPVIQVLRGTDGALLWSHNCSAPVIRLAVGDLYGNGLGNVCAAGGDHVIDVLSQAGKLLWRTNAGGPADYDLDLAVYGRHLAWVNSEQVVAYENLLAPVFSITGEVRDVAGDALEGVQVKAGGVLSLTDTNGAFHMCGLTMGNYTVTPVKAGHTFEPALRRVTLGPDANGLAFRARSSWPMFRKDARHGGLAEQKVPDNVSLAWRFQTLGQLYSSPAVYGGRVYIGDWSNLYALDADSGALLRSAALGSVNSCVAVQGQRLVVGTDQGLYCLNTDDFTQYWSAPMNVQHSSPIIANDRVYVGGRDGAFYCYHLRTGAKVWQYAVPNGVQTSPIVLDGKVYFGNEDDKLVCLSESTGGLLRVFDRYGYNIDSSPATDAQGLYVVFGCEDRQLYCLNRASLALRWSQNLVRPIYSTPAVAGGKVFIGSRDQNLYCFDLTSGSKLWNYQAGGGIYWSAPALAEDRVVFGALDNGVYCLDWKGKLVWQFATGGQIQSSPAIADQRVYIGSMDGYVYCLGPAPLPPVLELSTRAVDFQELATNQTASVSLSFENTGQVAATWQIATSHGWLTVRPTNGLAQPRQTQSLELSVDTTGLVPGQIYFGSAQLQWAGQVQAVTVRLSTRPEASHRLLGRVLDQNGRPQAGVRVLCAQTSASTDANGDYVLSGLLPGAYMLTPVMPDRSFDPATRKVEVSASDLGGQDFVSWPNFLVGPRLEVVDTATGTNRLRLDLPATMVGASSATASLTLRSVGSETVTITGLVKGGANANDFEVVVGDAAGNPLTNDFSILSGNSCTVEARFTPTGLGPRTATLSFVTNDPRDGARAIILSFSAEGLRPGVVYVDARRPLGGNGFSWATACRGLQEALAAAVPGQEIWVAEGTYLPGTNNAATFVLKEGVPIFGGFKGEETARDERDFYAHLTLLSGDLGGDDCGLTNRADNSWHVLTCTNQAFVDGIVIRGGRADGTSPDGRGGGLLCLGGAPVFSHCVFVEHGARSGAAVYCTNGALTLVNCIFNGNQAAEDGGAICVEGGAAWITNCAIVANKAGRTGGGMLLSSGRSVLENCILWSNTSNSGADETAQLSRAGGQAEVRYSCIQGLAGILAGPGNIGDDPRFADPTGADGLAGTLDDDLHLQSAPGRWTPQGWVKDQVTSPCVDAGNPASDFSLEPMPSLAVEMGAFGNTPTASKSDAAMILATPSELMVPEGSNATFQVVLSIPSSTNVTVNVARLSGDTDIAVESGASLLFTPGNWASAQTVVLSAAHDADNVNGQTIIWCSAPGWFGKQLVATELDDAPLDQIAVSPSRWDIGSVEAWGSASTSLALTNLFGAESQVKIQAGDLVSGTAVIPASSFQIEPSTVDLQARSSSNILVRLAIPGWSPAGAYTGALTVFCPGFQTNIILSVNVTPAPVGDRVLSLQNPKGGEFWNGVQTVQWLATGADWNLQDTVSLWYSSDDGVTWAVLPGPQRLTYNLGGYVWDTQSIPSSGRTRLRVSCDAAPAASDQSARFILNNTGLNYYVNDTNTVGDVYCAASGNDGNDGFSPDRPKASIQAVLDAYVMAPGDVIWVDTGNYTTPVSVTAIDSGVRIVGPPAPAMASIVAAASSAAVRLEGVTNVTVERLYLRGGYGVVAVDSTGCRVAGVVAYSSTYYGIYLATSTDCEVVNDLVYANGYQGLYLSGSKRCRVQNNTVYGNGAEELYVLGNCADVTIRNNILWETGGAIALRVDGNPSGLSSDYNDLYATGDGIVGSWGGVRYATLAQWRVAKGLDLHSLSEDPLLVAASGADRVLGKEGFRDDDFHLRSLVGSYHGGAWLPDSVQSVCIDTGWPQSGYANEPPPNGQRVNLGAYGGTEEASMSALDRQLVLYSPTGGEVWQRQQKVYWDALGPWQPSDQVKVELSADEGQTWQVIPGAAALPVNLPYFLWDTSTASSSGFCRLRVSFLSNPAIKDESGFNFLVHNEYLYYYVNDTNAVGDVYCTAPGNDGSDGLSPDRPKASIQAVLDAYAMRPADVIWVDTGNYTTPVSVTANDSGVRIVGPPAPAMASIVAAASSAAVRLEGVTNVTVERLYLRGGYGVVAVDSTGCRVAGVVAYSSTYYGIYLATSTDCEVVNDLVYANGYQGLYLSGSKRCRVQNNTVYGNGAEELYVLGNCADVTIRNNILWETGGAIALRVDGNPSGVSSDYNDLYATGDGIVGSWGGVRYATLAQWRVAKGLDLHSLSEDPLLVDVNGFDNLLGGENFRDDDFHLRSPVGSYHSGLWLPDMETSPCLDAGDPSTGYAGEPAPNGQRADLGAYGGTDQASLSMSGRRLVLYSPLGGEVWSGVQSVYWLASGAWQAADKVKLEVSLDGGGNWETVSGGDSLPYDLPAFEWDTRLLNSSGRCRFRVSYLDDAAVKDESGSNFILHHGGMSYYVNDYETAGDIYCSAPGSENHDGFSPDRPKASIQAVLDGYAMLPGDVIWVDTGNYPTAVSLKPTDSGVRILGPPAPAIASIVGPAGVAAVRMDGATNVTVEGLCVRGYYGVVVANSTGCQVARTVAYSCTGQGIYVESSTGWELKNNLVYANGSQGIYLSNSKQGWVENNTVYGNGAEALYVLSNCGEVLMRNNILWGSGAAAALRVDGKPSGVVSDYNDVYASGGGNVGSKGGTNYLTLAQWRSGTGQDGHSLSEDPLLVDANGFDNLLAGENFRDDDFHLKSVAGSYHGGLWLADDAQSPCIDTGSPETDCQQEPAPNGQRADLGAYGGTDQASLSMSGRRLALYSPLGGEVWSSVQSVYWLASGAWQTADKVKLEVSRDAGQTWQTVANATSLAYNLDRFEWDVRTIASSGRCRLRVSYVNDPRVMDESQFDFFVHHTGIDYYVNDYQTTGDSYCSASGSENHDGFSPDQPKASIQAVLDGYAMLPGDVIWVDTGNYPTAVSLKPTDSGVRILGPPAPAIAAIVSPAGVAAVRMDGATNITVEGLYVRGYYGVVVASSTGCQVARTVAYSCTGQGIYVESSTGWELKNNLVYANGSQGIYLSNSKQGWVENNTVYGNGAEALYVLSNCGEVLMRNNILWGSGAAAALRVDGKPSGVVSDYNDVYASGGGNVGTKGGTNYLTLAQWRSGTGQDGHSLSEDPLLVDANGFDNLLAGENFRDDDFHLKSVAGSYHGGLWLTDLVHSPCIDAGDSTSEFGDEPSPNGARINLGAHGGTEQASLSSATGNERLLVTDAQSISIVEGGTAAFHVRLGCAPSGPVVVSVGRETGDPFINVLDGGSLTFTADNWDKDQAVTLGVEQDGDALNGEAVILCSAPGWTHRRLHAVALDQQQPAIIASVDALQVPEGGSATFFVKLNSPPARPVEVAVAKTDGDQDISVLTGTSLEFDSWNWNLYQPVKLHAVHDADADDGAATIRCSAEGWQLAAVKATEIDDDLPAILSSLDQVSIPEGGTAEILVKLGKRPAAEVVVTVERQSGDTNLTVASGATLRFTPDNWAVAQTVLLAAAEDSDVMGRQAVIHCGAPGYAGKDILMFDIDNDLAGVLEVSPSHWTNAVALAGGVVQSQFLVVNHAPTAQVVPVKATDLVAGVAAIGATNISLSPAEFSLPARGQTSVLVSIAVPVEAAVGAYTGSLTFGSGDVAVSVPVALLVPSSSIGDRNLGLLSPAAGSLWNAEQTIQWQCSGRDWARGDLVSLYYSANDGSNWTQIAHAQGLPYDLGGFIWNTRDVADSGRARVGIGYGTTPVIRSQSGRFMLNNAGLNYYVNDTNAVGDVYCTAPGNDGSDGLSPDRPKASIQAVLDAYAMRPADVIWVDTGNYTTPVSVTAIDSGVRIVGPPAPAMASIVAAASSAAVRLEGVTNVTVERLYLRGGYGVVAVDSTGCRVAGVVAYSSTYYGIYLATSTDCEVVNDLVYANGYQGLYLSGSKRCRVQNNTVYGNGAEELYVLGNCADVTIRNNILWETGGAIALRVDGNPSGVSSDYNDLYATGDGIVGSWGGVRYATLAQWRVAKGLDLHSLSEDPLLVAASGADRVLGKEGFRDDDFHLRSLVGSYHGGAWLPDSVQSVCIDTGWPQSGYANEPPPNGQRVNLGAYGGTEEASLSSGARRLVLYSPLGGEVWSGVQSVYWLASGAWQPGDRVKLEVSQDAGQNWEAVSGGGSLPFDCQTFEWDTRTVDSNGRCRLRVSYLGDAGVRNESRFDFFVHHTGVNYYVNDYETAGDIYCSAPGSENNDGFSPDQPKASIQAVLDAYAMRPGDVIWVDTGNYTTPVSVTAIDSGVRIVGPPAPAMASIVAAASSAAVRLEGVTNVTVERLYLRGGYGVVAVDSTGCRVAGVVAYSSTYYGIYLATSTDCEVVNDLVYANGYQGLYLSGSKRCRVQNNTVYGNGAEELYVLGNCADVTIRNNILWETGGAIALRVDGNPSGVSSDYNDLYATGDGIVGSWGGVRYATLAQWRVAKGLDLHSLSEDPLLVDVNGFDNLLGGENFRDDDFHLRSPVGSYHSGLWLPDMETSPCLDAGDPSTGYAGEPAPNGQRADLGAYGGTDQASLSMSGRRLVLYSPLGGEVWSGVQSVYWLASGAWQTADKVKLEVSRDAGQTWQTVANATSLAYNLDRFEWDVRTIASSGRCRLRVSYVNDPRVMDESQFDFFVHHTGIDYYVNDYQTTGDSYCSASGSENHDGFSPDQPKASIQAVLDGYAMLPGDVIWVDTGNYPTAVSLKPTDSGVRILGPPAPAIASIVGPAGVAAVRMDGATNVTVEGLCVRGYYGVVVANSTGCQVARTVAYSCTGQGIYVESSTGWELKNNLVYANGSQGIYLSNSKQGWVENNTVYGNGAEALYVLSNCGEVLMRNNILWGSGAAAALRVDGKPSGVVSDYNDVYASGGGNVGSKGGTNYLTLAQWRSGTGQDGHSLSEDPLLVDANGFDNLLAGENFRDDDFHLKSVAGSYHGGLWLTDSAMSPCIDAGDPQSEYGNEPAYSGQRINLGAYGNTEQASKSIAVGPFYTLSLSASPADSGRVQAQPEAASYVRGEQVTLTAVPSPYYELERWLGDAAGTNIQIKVAVTTNLSIEARFKPTVSNTNGVPDLWLARYGIAPTQAGASADADRDGQANWQEFVAGTIPTNRLEYFQVTFPILTQDPREFVFQWNTVTGRTYTVYGASALQSVWTPLRQVSGTGAAASCTNSVASPSMMFFRVGVSLSQ